ncbi:integral membrane protein [Aspergillus ellipticus CBS 707.79]|uniref:Integral membrane protein n=1 Tax=Aspergillus ellipticus CBS 707.79 TaxID=1448320 RepID=A0A319CRH9_9EURO|nr:integral membrane protein [Aspergillus ellipticus CBS 707.79]
MPISSTTDPLDGISGEIASNGDIFKGALLFFMAISCYNVLELIILILSTFRRWKGLYFWSLLLSGCLGVIPYTLGFLLKFFTPADSTLSVTVLTVGWWVMVTGQAVVLYSRLHLVICGDDDRVLRWVLYMILANVVLLHVPTTVLTYGANANTDNRDRRAVFVIGYNIMEKVQMTGFTLQEVIISGLYVWETVKLLRLCFVRHNQRIMHQLVGINVAMLVMDLVLLGLEYASCYAVQITLKGAVYSVKLKLEFAVLGRLVAVVQNRRPISIDGDVVHLCSSREVTVTAVESVSSRGGEVCCDSGGGRRQERVCLDGGKVVTMTELEAWVDGARG